MELPALQAHFLAGKPLEAFTLLVYDRPSRAAKSRRVQGQAVEMKEHGYEELSVVVLERRADWSRIALMDGEEATWVPEPPGAVFRSYADLVKQSLAYLTEAWDGRVWDSPGGTPQVVGFRQIQRPQHPADIFEYRQVSGQLWLHVKVFSESPCEQQQPLSLVSGWIPAYSTRGEWTADFYSRGC